MRAESTEKSIVRKASWFQLGRAERNGIRTGRRDWGGSRGMGSREAGLEAIGLGKGGDGG